MDLPFSNGLKISLQKQNHEVSFKDSFFLWMFRCLDARVLNATKTDFKHDKCNIKLGHGKKEFNLLSLLGESEKFRHGNCLMCLRHCVCVCLNFC